MTSPILIWGAGAIGGTLGAAFIRAGQDVVFVDTDIDHVEAIRAGGLVIEGPEFQDDLPAPAFLPEELPGLFDLAFLCVPTPETGPAVRALSRNLSPSGLVICTADGLTELTVARALGPARVLSVFAGFAATLIDPGVIHFAARGPLSVGELDNSRSDRAAALAQLLRSLEPQAQISRNIWGLRWGALIRTTILAATALCNEGVAELIEDEEQRPLLAALAQEVAAVAHAEGVRLEPFDGFDPTSFLPEAEEDDIEIGLDQLGSRFVGAEPPQSALWLALSSGRPTEVKAQLTPVTAIAARHGLETPLLLRLLEMIEEIESGERLLTLENLPELEYALLPPEEEDESDDEA